MYTLLFIFIIISTITPIFSKSIGSEFSINFSIFSLFLSLLLSLRVFYEVVFQNFTCEIQIFDWINFLGVHASITLFFDKLSASMLFVVLFISFLVHLYASNYMSEDPCKARFFFFLSLFTFFMCLLVISGNLLQFFLAWEGVGLSSYLLINFWYTRAEANRSAMKAMIVNRFGDFGLYFALLIIFAFYKTLNFCTLNALSDFTSSQIITFLGLDFKLQEFIALFFLIAVVGKSAQLGLHTWLPDAMEGPTPVSALLHAATMVTAGIYLILRTSFIFSNAPNVMLIMSFWGALTAFFASSVGAFQNDIKKIIAYSTCSQLGYMMSACGMYNFIGAYFHLFNHAFFKALLFLGAGSIIHALSDEQDLRKYGRLVNFLPLTYISMLIGSLSLIGFPFLSGYYSKELIINWSLISNTKFSAMIYWLLLLAAFFTSYYSTKIIYLTFFSGSPRFSRTFTKNIYESDIRFIVPLVSLSVLSLFSGYCFFDFFVGYGNDCFLLSTTTEVSYLMDVEFLSGLRKNLPIFFVLSGSLTYLYWTTIFQKWVYSDF